MAGEQFGIKLLPKPQGAQDRCRSSVARFRRAMADTSDQEPDRASDFAREGRELLDAFYFPDDEDGRAKEFRENAIRLIVFDLHLAIEDLLKFFLHARIAEESVLEDSADIAYVKRLRPAKRSTSRHASESSTESYTTIWSS
jgi:hypothetical protein